jgi:hypothetical protein
VRRLATVAAATAIACTGLPAIVTAGLVEVTAITALCWVIADTGRSRRTAELLRAAHGDPPETPPLQSRARS